MTHFLKYLAIRIFLGTFVAVFVVYRVLTWVHEVLYAGREMDDRWLIVWVYLACLLVCSIVLSMWGRVRFNWVRSRQLKRISAEYHPKILVHAYRRLTCYLDSCFFFNTTRRKLALALTRDFGDMLLGMRIEDDQAQEIYEAVLLSEPDNERYYNFLIRSYSHKRRLSGRSFQYCRLRYHLRPDDKLIVVLSSQYVVRKILNFESERVLLRCMELYPRYRQRILIFAVPRCLHFKRMDDHATQFYLAALEEGSWGPEVLEQLRNVRQRHQEKERSDALALILKQALSGHPAGQAGKPRGSDKQVEPAREREFLLRIETPDQVRLDTGDSFSLDGVVFETGDEPEPGQGKGSRMSWSSRLYGTLRQLLGNSLSEPGFGNLRKVMRLAGLLVLTAAVLYLVLTGVKKLSRPEGGPELTSETSAVADSSLEGNYTIQVAAFRDSARAVKYIEQLKSDGVGKVYLSPWSSQTRKLYRVRIGPFLMESDAEKQASTLFRKRLIKKDYQVVPYGMAK